MIHDEYTREYDQRQERQRAEQRAGSAMRVDTNTAKRLGCRVVVKQTSVELIASHPSGDFPFRKFSTISEASEWCKRNYPTN